MEAFRGHRLHAAPLILSDGIWLNSWQRKLCRITILDGRAHLGDELFFGFLLGRLSVAIIENDYRIAGIVFLHFSREDITYEFAVNTNVRLFVFLAHLDSVG